MMDFLNSSFKNFAFINDISERATSQELLAAGNSLVLAGFRPNTRKTYSSAQKTFITFCEKYSKAWLPCDTDTILMYIPYLFYAKQLSSQSIKVYVSAIRAMHVTEGFANPADNVRVKLALKAIACEQKRPVQKKMAITYNILSRFADLLGNAFNDRMMWSAMTLAHFACMRTAEFVASSSESFDSRSQLRVSDISLLNTDTGKIGMRVFLKCSKTDPTGKGVAIYVGCSGTQICAVCSMHNYLALIRLDDHNSPLFRWENGLYLTRSSFVKRTKELVEMLGLDKNEYSGHSFRVGAATSGAAAGFSPQDLKILGRWSSDAYLGYIRTPIDKLFGFATRLAGNDRQEVEIGN